MDVDRFDHVCFVTDDIDKVSDAFGGIVGKKPYFKREDADAGVKENVFVFPFGFRVQEVTDAKKPLGKVLEGRKPGVYSIAMFCKDLKESSEALEKLGYKKLTEGLALTEGSQYAMFDTMEDIGFNIELWQNVDMYDYGKDETDVVE